MSSPGSGVSGVLELLEATLTDRGAAYSGSSADELVVFRVVAAMAGFTVPQVFMVLLSLKMARLRLGLDGATDVSDSVLDLAGYAALFRAYIDEQSGVPGV